MSDQPVFDLEVDRSTAGTTFVVRGDIDIATVPALERARERALVEGPGTLLIDLREVGFVDSSGLKFLLETHRLYQERGWELQLMRPAERAMKVFVVTGAQRHLPFLDAEE
jgi:anti-anti-sigma factor